MPPEMYGFLRLVGDPSEDEAEQVRAELARYAERQGFLLTRVYIENIRKPESAFQSLIDALKQVGVKDVIVPSLWHFARLPGLQEAMKAYIEQTTGARVWVAAGTVP
jgi:hypothetical protein